MTLKKILGVAGNATFEALVVSGSLLEHIPIPYLRQVANMFISIWQAVQQVTVSGLYTHVGLIRSVFGFVDEPPCVPSFDADLHDDFGFYI